MYCNKYKYINNSETKICRSDVCSIYIKLFNSSAKRYLAHRKYAFICRDNIMEHLT